MADGNRLMKTARGAFTVAQRRGLGYVGYLLGGVAWRRAAYRFGWGPTAPPILQGVFAAASELAASKHDAHTLRQLALLAPEGTGIPAADARPDEIERLMDRAHAAGITGVSRSFTSLVRTADGHLYFGDLSPARRHSPGSVPFVAARDEDRRLFNRTFGASVLTEATAREALQELKAMVPEGYRDYAPIDVGCGLAMEQVAATDFGTGRWDSLDGQI